MILPESLNNPILDKLLYTEGGRKKDYLNEVIRDFWLALISRELSLQGRREVLTGKAKFGVFGAGKEIPQIAMAKAFRKGDHRAGYYRDQTLMMALGISTPEQFLAQMYSDPNNDPFSGGRQMTGHFATPYIDKENQWVDQLKGYNISSGISCTGGQMGRAFGLAYASKKYRELDLEKETFGKFSDNGNEICFCTIGDASTSEGIFWETLNAAAVEKAPLLIAVWDDGYGISVPIEKQTVKGSISRALEGFLRDEHGDGIDLYTVDAYDYQQCCLIFEKAAKKIRKKHRTAVIHVKNCTQPQGHSTSGSHERYKSAERIAWEKEYDCNLKMEEWIIDNNILSKERCDEMRKEARTFISERKRQAWQLFDGPNQACRSELHDICEALPHVTQWANKTIAALAELVNPSKGEVLQLARRLIAVLHGNEFEIPQELVTFVEKHNKTIAQDFGTNLYAQGDASPLQVPVIHPEYDEQPKQLTGFQIINTFFDQAFAQYPELVAFGEDVGKIGDVNQGMAGLQDKYGEERVFDAGIREWSILGQGEGMAMRGLRPIAEIQYLDYLAYALPILTDDIATLRYRSNGLQQVPMIIRTRGHRLEGIWHTGSPLGMMINSLRGIHILTPRNMVQAAGMYNTLLQGSDPGIVIECLNGYRLKEKLPSNIGAYTVPLGIPEVLVKGAHLTLVTYGSCVRYAMKATEQLAAFGIEVELIDVQTLLPFDSEKVILASLKKTNKILFLDEDVPGGATAYMMQQVLEVQGGFQYLDDRPYTLTAKEHRTPYGNDGDYFAKPQTEDIVELVYQIVFEEAMY